MGYDQHCDPPVDGEALEDMQAARGARARNSQIATNAHRKIPKSAEKEPMSKRHSQAKNAVASARQQFRLSQ
jgi:hypothetical protein